MIPPDLEQTVRDLDAHVAQDGWDQPTRLFAVAETRALLEREPALAGQLSGSAEASPWTTIEQEGLPSHDDLDGLLGPISWPETVDGAAVSAERVMVSPDTAPGRQTRHELRATMAVLRDGSRCTVLRLREHDDADAVIVGEDLISGLGDLLMHTLT
jgi:hypothetical protein